MADGGGLEFLFELNAKFDEVSKMVKVLSSTEVALHKSEDALRKQQKEMLTLGKVSDYVGGGLKRFATQTLTHFLALASFEGLKSVAEKIVDIGREAITTAASTQRLEKSFGLLMGAGSEDLLSYLDGLAKNTEFTDGTLKSFASTLVRAGFKGEDLQYALAAVADMAALSEDKIGGASQAIAVLSRVKLQGMLGDRDLRGLGLNVAEFYKTLAADVGVGSKEVEKRMSAGLIKPDVVMRTLEKAISAKTGKALGGAGVEMSTTVSARLDKVKDLPAQFYDQLANSPGMQSLSESMAKMLDVFNPDSPSGKKVSAGMDRMLQRMADLLTKVDWDQIATSLVRTFELLPPLIEQSVKATLALARAVGVVVDALGSKPTGEAAMVARVDAATAKVARAEPKSGWDRFVRAITPSGALGAPAGGFGSPAGMAFSGGVFTSQGMAAGLEAGAPVVNKAAEGMAGGATKSVEDKLQIHSPSRVFAALGEMTGRGFAVGINAAGPAIEHALTRTMEPPDSAPIPAIPYEAQTQTFAPVINVQAQDVAGGRGGIGRVDITVNVGGGGGSDVATSAADAVRLAMQSVLEQYGAEVGA
jgi:hypothetical protein